jgi:predicted alpha/beta hydrolase family esterase
MRLPKMLANHGFDEQTVLVGHSGGAALLLAVLEHIDAAVARAVLVAGYCTQPNTEDEPVLQAGYDWAAIKAHVRDVDCINSRDDRQGRVMFGRLGGTQIVRDEGHFGDHDQPYETFELLDRRIG